MNAGARYEKLYVIKGTRELTIDCAALREIPAEVLPGAQRRHAEQLPS
jgi:hypothetical protein